MLPTREGWKEAKLGALVRHGEKDGRYEAVLGSQEEFHEAMKAALDVERWQSWQQVVWLADGLRANWILAETVCPTATQILDIIHAIENGVKCGKILLGEGSVWLAHWQHRIHQLLEAGDVDVLVDELMCCLPDASDAGVEELNRLVGYYRHNQSRMDYPAYRAQGLPIGSGIVESAHRHVLQKRMKLAGQRWSRPCGRRMATLRACYRTAGAARVHEAINRGFARSHARPSPPRRIAA